MARASATPLVDHTFLAPSESAADAIPVGSPDWYAWLAGASSFAFLGDQGSFTAHKERRGLAREYWKAYRRRAGRLYRVYLGKSSELTLDRLNAVAAALAGDRPAARAAMQHLTQDFGAPAASDQIQPDAAYVPAPADDARTLHLLATKLATPSPRPNLVARPRLVGQIDAAISQWI